MEKNGNVRLGSTRCDYCDNIATVYLDNDPFCDGCAAFIKQDKQASVKSIPIKGASKKLQIMHRGRLNG